MLATDMMSGDVDKASTEQATRANSNGRVAGTVIGCFTPDYGSEEHEYAPEERAPAGAVVQLATLVIERERLLRERAEAQASELALREVNRRMDEFLSVAIHELRSPLTTVQASLQLMRHRLQRAIAEREATAADHRAILGSLQHLMETAEHQTARLARVMADLLDVARIQSNHLELRPSPLDLIELVQHYMEEVRLGWPARAITLAAPAEAVTVEADGDRIGQVVTNYLTNALKYSAPGTPVEAAVQVVGDTARVQVRDQGQGLDPEGTGLYRTKRHTGDRVGPARRRTSQDSRGCDYPG